MTSLPSLPQKEVEGSWEIAYHKHILIFLYQMHYYPMVILNVEKKIRIRDLIYVGRIGGIKYDIIRVSLMHGNVILSKVIRFDLISSRFIWGAVSQVNRIWNIVLNVFNFKTFLAPRVFKNIVESRVLTLPCIMPCRVPVG